MTMRWQRAGALALAAATAACAVAGGLGWALEVPFLQTIVSGGPPMKPLAALGLAALAPSLALRVIGRHRGAQMLALAAVMVGLLALPGLVGGEGSVLGPRLPPATATCLALVGAALALGGRAGSLPAHVLLGVSLGVSGLAWVAFTYGLRTLGELHFFSTMAVHTSAGLTAAGAGALLATPAGPPSRPFLGRSAAATLGRRLLLAAVVVPWCSGWLVLQLEARAGLGATLALAAVCVLSVALLLVGVSRLTSEVVRHEQDLAITLDSIGDGVLLTDAQGTVTRLNPVAERLTGWRLEDAQGQPIDRVFDVVNEQSGARVESPVTRVLREGAVVGLANHTLLRDRRGALRPISDSGAPVRADDGQLKGAVLVFRDVSAEHEAQQRVERTAATLKSVMDATPIGFLAGHEGRAVYANPAAVKMLGARTLDDVLGRALLDFVAPEDAENTRVRVRAWAEGRPPPPRRMRLRGPAGEALVDSVPLAAKVEVDGRPAQLAMLQQVEDRDGLQRQLAQQQSFALATSRLSRELAESSFDLARILQTVTRVVCLTSDDLAVVRLWNAGAAELSRVQAAHTERSDLRQLLAAVDQRFAAVGEELPMLAQGQAVVLGPEAIARAVPAQIDPAARPREIVLLPLRAQGRTLGLLSLSRFGAEHTDPESLRFLQDVADRAGHAVLNARLYEDVARALDEKARALTALEQTEVQLRHSQKLDALGQLAGGIAHDFNNVLSVILSVTDLLVKARPPDDPEREDLLDVFAAGTRAAELTRRLLAFSRKQVMQLEARDVNEVVRSLARMLDRLIGEDVTLEFALADELAPVQADAALLTQAVMNLVVNARDALPTGGRVWLRTRMADVVEGRGPPELPPGRFVCVEVEDDGPGVPPEVREHLFEPFFTTKRGKGTGLGLSTSYGIARQSGGTISLERAERGARFVVWLPASAGAAAHAPPAAVPVEGQRRVILLVEDEPGVRAVARRVLERAGFELHVAESAAEALAVAATLGPIDLLLTDVVMPGQSGRELADALTLQRAGLRVLFMSGYTDDVVVRRGVDEGKVALLQKPFTPDTLLEAVRRALG